MLHSLSKSVRGSVFNTGRGKFRCWCHGLESNQRPPPYEGDALPTELPWHMAEQAGLEPTIRVSPNTRFPSGPNTNYRIAPKSFLPLLYAAADHGILTEIMATRVGVEPTSLQKRLPVFGTGQHSRLPSSTYWRRAWDSNPNTQHKPGYCPISNRGPYHLGLPLHILITNSIAPLSPSRIPDALSKTVIFKKKDEKTPAMDESIAGAK